MKSVVPFHELNWPKGLLSQSCALQLDQKIIPHVPIPSLHVVVYGHRFVNFSFPFFLFMMIPFKFIFFVEFQYVPVRCKRKHKHIRQRMFRTVAPLRFSQKGSNINSVDEKFYYGAGIDCTAPKSKDAVMKKLTLFNFNPQSHFGEPTTKCERNAVIKFLFFAFRIGRPALKNPSKDFDRMWAGFDKCEFSVQLQREQLLVRPKGTLPEPNQFQIDISFWPHPVLLPAGDTSIRCLFDTVPAPALRDLFGMSATCKTHCEHLISLTGTHHCHWQISAPTQAYATQFMLTAVSGWWGWLIFLLRQYEFVIVEQPTKEQAAYQCGSSTHGVNCNSVNVLHQATHLNPRCFFSEPTRFFSDC